MIVLPFRYLQEYTALGTAGGMYHFRDQILSGDPELFFVMNSDVCGDFPLQDMLDFHRFIGPNPHFTILATEVGSLVFAYEMYGLFLRISCSKLEINGYTMKDNTACFSPTN